jgi:hypothetical protein
MIVEAPGIEDGPACPETAEKAGFPLLAHESSEPDRTDPHGSERVPTDSRPIAEQDVPAARAGDTLDALAKALDRASAAEQWDVVAALAAELRERRLAAAGVASLPARRCPGGR